MPQYYSGSFVNSNSKSRCTRTATLPHDAPHTAARDFLVVSPEGLQRPPLLLLLLLLLRLLLQSIHSHSSLLSFWAGPESLGNSMVSLHFVR